MNKYRLAIQRANEADSQKSCKLNLRNEAIWQYYNGVEMIDRPTENTAFANLEKASRILSIVGIPEFDDDEWKVYLKDIELRYRNQNSNFVMPSDIAKELPNYNALRVSAILGQVDLVMELRAMLNMPILPPIPFKFTKRFRTVARLRKVA